MENFEEIESKSWICNYLEKKEIIDKNEFFTLSRFGVWVTENHPNIIKAYWSYLDKLMDKFDNEVSFDNAKKIFRPWVNETIGYIKSSQYNRAYNSFCVIVIFLTEKYNHGYHLFSKKELEVYLGLKKSMEDKRLLF